MQAEQRRNTMEQMIKEQKEVNVNIFRDKFGISNVTVRNDLLYLERKGVIKRLFGKAVYRDDNVNSVYDINSEKNIEMKEKIGKYAASLIEENESVLLYTGSTTYQVARFLPENKNIIAVTNSIYIAHKLRKNNGVKTILIGGNFNNSTGATYGATAINQLREYNIDKVFLAVDGISAAAGVTNDNPFETDINNAIFEKETKIIIVADYSKIGKARFIKMGQIESVDMLITDNKANKRELEKIKNKGIEIVTV